MNKAIEAIAKMKKAASLGLVFSLFLGAASDALAGAGRGGAPGQFLSYGTGARSMAMGKAFTAIADDASAVYWNPAAMVQVDRKELQAMHVTLFEQTNFDSVSYIHPTSRAGVVGFNMTRLVSGGFEKVDVKVDPTSQDLVSLEKIGSFSDISQAYSISYGRPFTDKLSIGASLKMVSHQVDTFAQKFITMDVSFFDKQIFPNTRMGFVAQNVVSQKPGNSDDKLPLTMRFGIAYSMMRDRINLALDISQNSFSGSGYNFGVEYWVMRWAALRIGIESHADGISETTAGMGMKYRNYSLDLGVAVHDLGMSQRASASWRFGKSTKGFQKDDARKILAQGHELFKQGNYIAAIQKFNAALDVDPGNKEIQSMVAKLQDIVTDLPKAPTGDVGRLVAAGVKSYMDGNMDSAYDNFRSAFDKEPDNAALMNLTNRIAKLTGKQQVEQPKGAAAAARWTLVDQKLHDALQAIYEGRYDVAIQKCDEVLRIEPNNVVAIGRMGAAFFLMGERDKAVALWKRALELDPNHKPAIEYLQQLGEYGH